MLLPSAQTAHFTAFDGGRRGALTVEELRRAIALLATPAAADGRLPMTTELYATVAARKLLFFHGRAGR